MKVTNIIGLGLALICSFSTLAKTQNNLEKRLANASETLVGTWEQKCDGQEGVLKFDDEGNVELNIHGDTHDGTWKVKKDKLVLKYDDQSKEKWIFTKFNNKKFTITNDDITCTAKKTR